MGLQSTYRRCQFWQEKIIFSVEAQFDLAGYVTKQNCHNWRTEDLHAYIKKPTQPKQVNVWCGFWSRGIIGPFFLENEQREAVTVNSDRYRAILNEFLFTKIEKEDIGNIWLQQDGSMCDRAEAALDVLRPVFEDRIISRRADVVWAPRNCDLTPLDYYLGVPSKISVTPTSPRDNWRFKGQYSWSHCGNTGAHNR